LRHRRGDGVTFIGELAFVWDYRPGYGDHRDKVIQACEIAGICRVQREFGRDRCRGNHELHFSAARLPARRDHGRRHPPVGPGGIRVKGDRVELVLGPLQHVQPTRPLGSLEVGVLFGVGGVLRACPAESSASVTAPMAISSGSSSGAIRLRRIMMLASSRTRRTGSLVTGATGLLGDGLVGPERIRVDRRGGARHRSELRPAHATTALPQRHQIADTMPVTGYREGLPALDRVPGSPWIASSGRAG
jgi:hypothetical protein